VMMEWHGPGPSNSNSYDCLNEPTGKARASGTASAFCSDADSACSERLVK